MWAATGPLRLRHFSCLECGHRATTWAAFRLHRVDCAHELVAHPAPEGWALTADDLDRLAALDAQLRGESPEALAAQLAGERTEEA